MPSQQIVATQAILAPHSLRSTAKISHHGKKTMDHAAKKPKAPFTRRGAKPQEEPEILLDQGFKFLGFRTDTEDLFKLSEINDIGATLKHSKIIVIRKNGEIECLDTPNKLRDEDPDTDVIARWQGQWRSDLFHFKAGDYQKAKSL